MKILHVTTYGGSVRDEIVGWTLEDSDLYNPAKPIGYTPAGGFTIGQRPGTILEALHYGWKLLGSPVQYLDDEILPNGSWDWWLSRDY